MSRISLSLRPMSTLRRPEPQATECFRKGILHRPAGPSNHLYADSPHMVVLFTWLGAKERYAHKYVHSWTRRGFHVLQVTTTVRDLLMPRTGTETTAKRVVDYLNKKDDFNFLLHGLSVGGYGGTRVLYHSQDTGVLSRITSQIYDSFTHIAGIHAGVENAVPARYKNIASSIARLYTNYADMSVFYETDFFLRNHTVQAPSYFMHSLADRVARFDVISGVIKDRQRVAPVSTLFFPESQNIPHVALFRHLGEDPYMSCILRFLRRTNFPLKEKLLQEIKEDEDLISLESYGPSYNISQNSQ